MVFGGGVVVPTSLPLHTCLGLHVGGGGDTLLPHLLVVLTLVVVVAILLLLRLLFRYWLLPTTLTTPPPPLLFITLAALLLLRSPLVAVTIFIHTLSATAVTVGVVVVFVENRRVSPFTTGFHRAAFSVRPADATTTVLVFFGPAENVVSIPGTSRRERRRRR